jgi:hypothetical protein
MKASHFSAGLDTSNPEQRWPALVYLRDVSLARLPLDSVQEFIGSSFKACNAACVPCYAMNCCLAERVLQRVS